MTKPGVRTDRRAQSETVGAVLLIGVVVIAVSTIGATLLLAVEAPDNAAATADVEVTEENVTVTHTGGDPVAYDQLVVVVETDSDRFSGPLDPAYVDGDPGDAFTAGTRWERSLSSVGLSAAPGDRVRVRVLYRPSSTSLFDGTVEVSAAIIVLGAT